MMDQELAKSIVEAVTKRVDERLGEAFHKFDGSLEKRTGLMLEAHEQHRRAIVQLQRAVFGSDAPPPDDDASAAKELDLSPRAEPLPKRITESEGSVAELTGIVLNVKAELAEHRKSSEEDRTKAAAVLAEHTAVLAEQTQILTSIKGAVTGVISHPMAKWVAHAAAVAAVAWLTQAQARIEARAEKIEHDVAKVAADGGAR